MENDFQLDRIVEPLLKWYDHSHRILPWREEPVPYRVWVSEIMLQQTRVEAVKPYYERFLRRLPDISHLAEVSEEELLKLWEGLGYYNRARNLKKAAVLVMEKYGGKLPDSYGELLKLPGIGSYTAGAVASISFGQKVPAVDGNVMRVISRVSADERDIMSQAVRKDMEKKLAAIMPEKRAGDFNQGLMELGATVCIPHGAARCEQCPWSGFCQARRLGKVLNYPKKTGKKPRVIEEKTILVIQDENRTAFRKRPEKGLLAGLYEFPSLEGYKTEREVLAWLKKTGYKAIYIKKLEQSKHIFTHREWHMSGYLIRVDELDRPETHAAEGFLFANKEEAEKKYPLPAAFQAYAKYLKIRLGNEKYVCQD